LSGGFKGHLRRRLACHSCGHRHLSYDELHLQLGPLLPELTCRVSPPPTQCRKSLSRARQG
jgi:transcriptional regulator NrdR family protein